MSDTDYLEVPLFDFADRIERETRQTLAQTARRSRPVWTKYTAQARRQCDPCVVAAREADERGQKPPIPRHARHIRRVPATGAETAYCDTCSIPAKALDEQPKATRARRR